MFRSAFHKFLSSQLKPVAIITATLYLVGWLFNIDELIRNLFLGWVAKISDPILIYVIVFFVTHPYLIPLFGILFLIFFMLLYDLVFWFLTDWNRFVKLHSDIVHIVEKKTKTNIYGASIQNNGFTDIKECFVDLEDTFWFPINEQNLHETSQHMNIKGRLGWVEDSLQSRECKRNIEGRNQGISIKIAEFDSGKPIKIKLCDEKLSVTKSTYGEMFGLIRIGGIVNNWAIRPIYATVRVSQNRRVKAKDITVQVAGTGVRILKNRDEFYSEVNWFDNHYKENQKNKPQVVKKERNKKKKLRKPD